MNSDWVKIYSAGNLYKVDLVKGLLEESGIKSEILNQKDSAFLTGDVELFVDTKDFEEAKRILAERKDFE
ncbi:MAG TPA: DUF2007 domain-containing protein [Bacteroidales bacterium]|nr:DUF2007 domain-containing protein [Bacteroidales bacterium]HPR57349.1 DUF2007 domain-containing protein [Bacteroidales bacterium]HRW97625.1 DUF2007 domain-containing protein [Bacteroidales bacterium]